MVYHEAISWNDKDKDITITTNVYFQDSYTSNNNSNKPLGCVSSRYWNCDRNKMQSNIRFISSKSEIDSTKHGQKYTNYR